jgi:hypothetical protein
MKSSPVSHTSTVEHHNASSCGIFVQRWSIRTISDSIRLSLLAVVNTVSELSRNTETRLPYNVVMSVQIRKDSQGSLRLSSSESTAVGFHG